MAGERLRGRDIAVRHPDGYIQVKDRAKCKDMTWETSILL
jgi:hypothetical protein